MKPYVLQPGTIPHRAYEWIRARQAERDAAQADRFTCTTAEMNAALETGLDDASFITCLNKARYGGYFYIEREQGPNGRIRLRWSLGSGRPPPPPEPSDVDRYDAAIDGASQGLEQRRAAPEIQPPATPVVPLPRGETVTIERPAKDNTPHRKPGRPPAPPPEPPACKGPGWKHNPAGDHRRALSLEAPKMTEGPSKIVVEPKPPAPAAPWPQLGDPLPDARAAWPLIVPGPRPTEFMAGRTDDGSLIVERAGVRVRYTPDETAVIACVTRGLG